MARLDFTKYNYDELVEQLKAIVAQQSAWKDTAYAGGTGSFLIELFAYVTEMLMYYLERRAQESYIDTAQIKSSITRLVSLIGYRPKRKTSGAGTAIFTLPGGWHDGNIYIPQGTIVRTTDGIAYFVEQDVVIRRGVTAASATIVQGELLTISYSADGTADFEVLIDDTDIEDSRITVTIDGIPWVMVDNFAYSTDVSTDFMQVPQLDGTVKIVFGDGKFGKYPTTGQVVEVNYIKTTGLAGNIYSTGQVTVVDSVLYDEYSVDVSDLVSVTNSTNCLGGDDEETADEIRREAPNVFKTGDRAVTREDYIAILENIPGVATAYVWGERDENPPNIIYFNKVRIVVLLQDWALPDSTFKASIAEALIDKEQLTVWLDFLDPDVIDTIANVAVKVKDTYQSSVVLTEVSQMLDTLFALGTVKLGTPVRLSDVIAGVESVSGVEYTHLDFTHRELLGVGDGANTYFSATLYLLPLVAGTVELYLNNTLVATDDGFGNFSEATLTGVVDYATGVTTINFGAMYPPGLGVNVYIRYKQDQDGDIVTDRTEIAKLIEKNLSVL